MTVLCSQKLHARLTDIRTPSSYDAVYCDPLQPYDPGSALLTYGTERFVAGSHMRPDLCFFDFRQPKAYHWTNAYSCSSTLPYPAPPLGAGEQLVDGDLKTGCDRCDPRRGAMCLWHAQSRSHRFRPDATMMNGSSTYDGVFSLAKASDLSDRFYCGMRACVTEVRPMLADDATVARIRSTAPEGWRVGKPSARLSFVETGLGILNPYEGSNAQWALNMTTYKPQFGAKKNRTSDRRARLDPSVM